MLDTILFDLDGTLLPMDLDEFIEKYFYEIGNVFKERIEPKKLIDYILEGTKAMIMNDGRDTNENVFMETFSKFIGAENLSEYRAAFDHFYDNDFIKTKSVIRESGKMTDSLEILKDKGYTLAIATNPIFPLKAVIERIKWAELCPDDFKFISCYEVNSYSKPNVGFYREVADALDKKPEQCIMVGNDVQEDLSAAKLGMKTYLIKDYIINRGNQNVICTYQGCYTDFLTWVKNLEPVQIK